MGKKSKRSRSSGTTEQQPQARKASTPPALREAEEETKDNLRFQDPFIDDWVEEDEEEEEHEEMMNDEQGGEDVSEARTASWNPLTGEPVGQAEELEMDPSAYKMYHAFTNKWPSLSFDFIRDELGESRTRFPHSFMAVIGSQAPTGAKNELTLVKLSDLGRIKVETEDDILGEPLDDGKDDLDSDSDEDDVDLDPIMEHVSVKHHGSVNRIRALPQRSEIVATWSDQGQVNIFDVSSWMEKFSGHSKSNLGSGNSRQEGPIYTYKGHRGVEGYAMDWSLVTTGNLATGDCNGNIHLWQPEHDMKGTQPPSFGITPSYEAETSVEDIQWSPTEDTVLAVASCEGYVRIYDTRAPNRAMLTSMIHEKTKADVNVLSWNRLVANLMATGGDDGTLSVWDLRNSFQEPLARFTSHKTPITSVEWHPTDESMLAVSDDVGTYVYDLSIEEDEEAGGNGQGDDDISPQLLFVHCGSEQFKEAHWHPQITSCIMTTALTGFSVFIPSNL